jgi:hypothetical protein
VPTTEGDAAYPYFPQGTETVFNPSVVASSLPFQARTGSQSRYQAQQAQNMLLGSARLAPVVYDTHQVSPNYGQMPEYFAREEIQPQSSNLSPSHFSQSVSYSQSVLQQPSALLPFDAGASTHQTERFPVLSTSNTSSQVASTETESLFHQYEVAMKTVFEDVQAGRLVTGSAALLDLSNWLLSGTTNLGKPF